MVLGIVNVDSCQHGGQCTCVSCFFCVTLAINKSFLFHPVGVSSFFVRMASNLFSCLSVPSSLLPRECSCLGHACCRRFRDAIICLCVIVGLSFLLLLHLFSECKKTHQPPHSRNWSDHSIGSVYCAIYVCQRIYHASRTLKP